MEAPTGGSRYLTTFSPGASSRLSGAGRDVVHS